MSKFKGGSAFIIIQDTDITTTMVNLSTSTSKNNMPSKTSSGTLYRIVEVLEPVPEIFNTYTWYCKDSIISAWDALP